MQPFEGISRLLLLGFFSSHIVFSLTVDAQAVLPTSLVPDMLQQVVAWYVVVMQDPLMAIATTRARAHNLHWFQSFVACELIFQVPFFFVACYMIATKASNNPASKKISTAQSTAYPTWFRYACIVYGAHTVTTMIPILTTLFLTQTIDTTSRALLLSLYIPYLIFPLWILVAAVTSPPSSSYKAKSL